MDKWFKLLVGLAGPVVFLLLWQFGGAEVQEGVAVQQGVEAAAQQQPLSTLAAAVLGVALWMALWWTTEVVPIAVTSLVPIIAFPLCGALEIGDTTSSYGHKYIFLYVGGFILALAIERWGLHRRIALNLIRVIGASPQRVILGFMIATAFLSMWISNTATSVMMLPIGMAIVAQLTGGESKQGAGSGAGGESGPPTSVFGKALMLGIAYSASIGGVATLIGTPPNLVLAGMVTDKYGIEIGFAQWMIFAAPISVILLLLCWYYLTHLRFRLGDDASQVSSQTIQDQVQQLGKMSSQERKVLIVFSVTAVCWMFRSVLQSFLPVLSGVDDTMIAIGAAIVLFLIPAGKDDQGNPEVLMRWQDTRELPWGIVLLFGGGLALAKGVQVTGLAQWLGDQFTVLHISSLLLWIVLLVAVVNFLTEVTSNVATTTMFLPVLAALALSIGAEPLPLMVAATIAASCAFMLPVATPPNAVVFGSGQLTIAEMAKTGFVLNVISILLVSLFVWGVLPWVWGDALQVPSPVAVPEAVIEIESASLPTG